MVLRQWMRSSRDLGRNMQLIFSSISVLACEGLLQAALLPRADAPSVGHSDHEIRVRNSLARPDELPEAQLSESLCTVIRTFGPQPLAEQMKLVTKAGAVVRGLHPKLVVLSGPP